MASTAELQAEHGPNWRSLKPDCAQPERQGAHEQRVIGHVGGWQERKNECVCGKPWPCPDSKPSPPQDDIVAGLRKMRADNRMLWDEERALIDRAIAALEEKRK